MLASDVVRTLLLSLYASFLNCNIISQYIHTFSRLGSGDAALEPSTNQKGFGISFLLLILLVCSIGSKKRIANVLGDKHISDLILMSTQALHSEGCS